MSKELKDITDVDAIACATLLLADATSDIYNYTFVKIHRNEWDLQHGCDAEESIVVHFKGEVKDEVYRKHGWKDEQIMISIIVRDRYRNYPFFSASEKYGEEKTWRLRFISNVIMAVQFLMKEGWIENNYVPKPDDE
jgi:hypothetical protein